MLDELGPRPGAESEYGEEHADAVALAHAAEPTPDEEPAEAEEPAPESEPEWPLAATERSRLSDVRGPPNGSEPTARPRLAGVPELPEEKTEEQPAASALGSELTPASSRAEVLSVPSSGAVPISERMRQVFLAHGRDHKWMQAVAHLLERSGPHEVTVLTADDVGAPRLQTDEEPYYSPRARQGVVFEMGFLVAALTPGCVCVLYEDGVEMPCDVDGITYVRLDYAGTWQSKLLVQLRKAGFDYDLNKLADVSDTG